MVCSIAVSGSAVALKERQVTNRILDRQKNVLSVADTEQYTSDVLKQMSTEDVNKAFADIIRAQIVNLETGEVVEEVAGFDADSYDQKRALLDPELSYEAPVNDAKVLRMPYHGLVYKVVDQDEEVTALILPVEGKGLWSTMYGFVALDKDTTTIKGLTFYQHGETPGLGGEIDNPTWKAKWPGKKVFNDQWDMSVNVAKGMSRDETHQVDGLSGATLTARGVTYLLQFWLGDEAFGLYLENFREDGA